MIRWDSENANLFRGWQDRAAKGDTEAVDRLLSRPALSNEAIPYWSAFITLSRDRPHESISMGMSGGLTIPRPVPRETIRREGRRLGYSGDGLEDFVEIVACIDDALVETEVKRAATEQRIAADHARQNRR